MSLYTDPLWSYVEELVKRYLEIHDEYSLPTELKGIEKDRQVRLITEHAIPIFHMIENVALTSALEKTALLIRYSLRSGNKYKKD